MCAFYFYFNFLSLKSSLFWLSTVSSKLGQESMFLFLLTIPLSNHLLVGYFRFPTIFGWFQVGPMLLLVHDSHLCYFLYKFLSVLFSYAFSNYDLWLVPSWSHGCISWARARRRHLYWGKGHPPRNQSYINHLSDIFVSQKKVILQLIYLCHFYFSEKTVTYLTLTHIIYKCPRREK